MSFISEVDAVYVCRTNQGRKTLTLWRNSWYHSMYNVIADVSHNPR